MDFSHRAAGKTLDNPIELDERHPQIIGEHSSERRLAGAAKSDQRDAPIPRRIDRAGPEQLGKRLPRLLQPLFITTLEQLPDQQPFGRSDGFLPHEFGDRAIQRLRQLSKDQDRCIPDAGFQVGEMSFRDSGFLRQHLAGHAAAGAQRPDSFAQHAEKRIAYDVERGGSLIHVLSASPENALLRLLHLS
jgi:hypothetical protein